MVKTLRPSSLSRTLALVPPVVALVAQHADGTMFLKIDSPPVTGESLDSKHSGWIEVYSMQFGISTPVSLGTAAGGITAGKPAGSELTVTKSLDKSSPGLFLGCALGTVYGTVTLELTSSGATPVTYYKITLSNVIVSSLSTSSGGDRPSESVSLSFEKITTDYYLVDAKGAVPTTPTSTASWNFVTNTPK